VEAGGFVFVGDMQASRVMGEIAKLYREVTVRVRVAGMGRKKYEKKKERRALSIKSRNYYLKAVKHFFKRMVDDQRIAESPLAHLKCQNAEKDIRRVRRALSEAELEALIAATSEGKAHHGLTGRERAMLYLLAVNSGLRASELASLTWRSFEFDKAAPTVTVAAAYSKHGKEDVQPLRRDVAGLFEGWCRERAEAASERVFRIRPYMERAALEGLPGLPGAGGDAADGQREVALRTGTDGVEVRPAESVYKAVYKRLAEKAYSGGLGSACVGTAGGDARAAGGGDGGFDKSLQVAMLGARKNPPASFDTGGFACEAEGARTLNLRIDSPML